MKNSFLIYNEYAEILEDLSNEEVGILFRAIFDYEINRKEPKFTGLMKMAFKVIKGNLDRDRNKYDKRCETSAENGKRGGRPKTIDSAKIVTLLEQGMSVTDVTKLTGASKRQIYRIQAGLESVPKPNQNLKKPKKPDNDNENDTDTDTENDNDNDSDAEYKTRGTSADLSDADENGTNADLSISSEEERTSADLSTSKRENEKSADLFDFIQNAFGRTLNSIEYEMIQSWEDSDLTRYAVKESILNGARGIRYIQTVLESWKAKGFKTVQEVQAYQNKRRQMKISHDQDTTLARFDNAKDIEISESEEQELKNILAEMEKG